MTDAPDALPRYRIVPRPDYAITGEFNLQVRHAGWFRWHWTGIGISADRQVLRTIAEEHASPKTFPPAPDVEYIP